MSKILSQEALLVSTKEQLRQHLLSFKKELFNLRFQKALGELKNTSRFSVIKKSVARINTELTKRLKVGE